MTWRRYGDKQVIFDAAPFFAGFQKYFEKVYTTPFVLEEVKDSRSRFNLELYENSGRLLVIEPEPDYYRIVEEKLREANERGLTRADKSVVALAVKLKNPVVFTDDLAVQNVLLHLGIEYYSVKLPFKLQTKKRVSYFCSSCHRTYSAPGRCEVCGTTLVRRVERS